MTLPAQAPVHLDTPLPLLAEVARRRVLTVLLCVVTLPLAPTIPEQRRKHCIKGRIDSDPGAG
ncbi:MAG: hypothetical protein Q8P18_11225 [Pseudomonadota bacterium]|nr:hypothetical protein [Pseudomonadota bacterium]